MSHVCARRVPGCLLGGLVGRTLALTLVLVPLVGLAACADGRRGGGGAGRSRDDGLAVRTAALSAGRSPGAASPITLDGDISDWPTDAAMLADDEFLYVRFMIAPGVGEADQPTLQGAPQPISILLDLDASTKTGFVRTDPRLHQMGVDLEITFSPADKKRGVSVAALDAQGVRTPLAWEDVDLTFAPTYAASWYEARIARSPSRVGGKPLPLPTAGLLSATAGGPVDAVVTVQNAKGAIVGVSDLMSCEAAGPARPHASPLDLPAREPGTIRVLSWNIEKSAPVKTPGPFASVINAARPDVVLIQEWEDGNVAQLRQWFDSNCPIGDKTSEKAGDRARTGGGWYAVKAPGTLADGGGVAVVSRWAMDPIVSPVTLADGKKVRFASAWIATPFGDMLAGSLHLKCCGTKGSPEDQQRMNEARAINAYVADNAANARIRVIGGDFNLVGSRPPLDLLRKGLDTDGTDLTPAPTQTLGDRSFLTWRNPGEFTPGRLDWILTSDATVHVTGAWSIDALRLNDDALALMRIGRDATAASDHLPVVVDLKPVK